MTSVQVPFCQELGQLYCLILALTVPQIRLPIFYFGHRRRRLLLPTTWSPVCLPSLRSLYTTFRSPGLSLYSSTSVLLTYFSPYAFDSRSAFFLGVVPLFLPWLSSVFMLFSLSFSLSFRWLELLLCATCIFSVSQPVVHQVLSFPSVPPSSLARSLSFSSCGSPSLVFHMSFSLPLSRSCFFFFHSFSLFRSPSTRFIFFPRVLSSR